MRLTREIQTICKIALLVCLFMGAVTSMVLVCVSFFIDPFTPIQVAKQMGVALLFTILAALFIRIGKKVWHSFTI